MNAVRVNAGENGQQACLRRFQNGVSTCRGLQIVTDASEEVNGYTCLDPFDQATMGGAAFACCERD